MTPWPAAISFVHPAFLWGALAVAVPILIHLWTRRIRRRIPWAAMELLLAARTSLHPYVRLRHWLLLALRCLALLLLVLAIARPVMRVLLPRAAGAGREYRMVLDDSLSMQTIESSRSRFDAAREAAAETIRRLAVDQPDTMLTLYRVSQPSRPLIDGVSLSSERSAEIIQRIERLQPSYASADWAAMLTALELDAAGRGDFSRDLLLIGDFLEADWLRNGQAGPLLGSLGEVAGRYDAATLLQVASQAPANLFIESLEPENRAAIAGRTQWFELRVRNGGGEPSDAVEIESGAPAGRPSRFMIPSLPPDGSHALRFGLEAAGEGDLLARATLPPDALDADNQRFAVLPLRASLSVLVVDDSTGVGPKPSLFITRALDPPGTFRSGFDCRVLRRSVLSAADLEASDLVIIADGAPLPVDLSETFRDYLRGGGGAIIFMGQQAGEETLAGLPFERLRLQERPEVPEGLLADEAFLDVGDGFDLLLSDLRAARWWEIAPGDAVRVAARFDPSGHAAWLLADLGEGRVEVCATAAAPDWNNWAAHPAFVLILQQAAMRTARRGESDVRNIPIGARARVGMDPQATRPQATWLLPDEGPSVLLQAESIPGGLAFLTPESAVPGLASLRTTRHDGAESSVAIAVATAASESAIAPALPDQLASGLPETLRVLTSPQEILAREGGGSEGLWRVLLLALLAVLVLESTLACRMDESGKAVRR